MNECVRRLNERVRGCVTVLVGYKEGWDAGEEDELSLSTLIWSLNGLFFMF